MTCVKTGCHIYIVPYGIFAYGDAHEVDGTYFFRLVETRDTPFIQVLHYELNDFVVWWERYKMSGASPSTLVVKLEDVISYGYEGRDIREFDHIVARLK